MHIHTYIHNWPLQSFSQDYSLASHSTHIRCVNFINKRWVLQFYVAAERQIFEKLFHVSFCQKSAEKKSPKKYFYFKFHFDALPGIRTGALPLISQHTTHQTTLTSTHAFIFILILLRKWKWCQRLTSNDKQKLQTMDLFT